MKIDTANSAFVTKILKTTPEKYSPNPDLNILKKEPNASSLNTISEDSKMAKIRMRKLSTQIEINEKQLAEHKKELEQMAKSDEKRADTQRRIQELIEQNKADKAALVTLMIQRPLDIFA